MPTSRKRRKAIVFALIGLAVAALAAVAIFRKREAAITVQTEKVSRRNITELVRANGKIQPVIQVKISPEVSGEIIALPVKEGQQVRKGDLILKIKPDYYNAARNQAEAGYNGSLAQKATTEANLIKAEAEFKRIEGLFASKLVSDSLYDEAKAGYEVAKAQLTSATHQVASTRASLARAEDDLSKTTIVAPISGTISKLNSEVGERVVGTAMMAGSDVMTIADLDQMEARVDIGEVDVVLIACGQNVRLEVDAFKDRKFSGRVTQIANSSKTASYSGTTQEATKFEVRIRITEKEAFRPGMSVTAEIETRSRPDVLTVPIASVTTRVPKEEKKKGPGQIVRAKSSSTNSSLAASPPTQATGTNVALAATNSLPQGTNTAKADKAPKPIEVVFLMENGRAKMVPVKIGVSDDEHWEIIDGVKEGQEVISGGFRAISRDLDDGKKVRKGLVTDKQKEGEEQKKDS